jgi:hypothetical protein
LKAFVYQQEYTTVCHIRGRDLQSSDSRVPDFHLQRHFKSAIAPEFVHVKLIAPIL